jgi:hypothetical protein
MQSVVGIAVLVVGVVLIIFGMQASASLGSRLSELFTGAPSDRTIWLLVAGVAAAGSVSIEDRSINYCRMLRNGTIVPLWQQIIEDDFQVLLHAVRGLASRFIMAAHHVHRRSQPGAR